MQKAGGRQAGAPPSSWLAPPRAGLSVSAEVITGHSCLDGRPWTEGEFAFLVSGFRKLGSMFLACPLSLLSSTILATFQATQVPDTLAWILRQAIIFPCLCDLFKTSFSCVYRWWPT